MAASVCLFVVCVSVTRLREPRLPCIADVRVLLVASQRHRRRVHLDREAWLEADAAALSLMTEVDDRTLTMVASMWSQRYYHFDTDTCCGPTGPEADRAS